ncbi:MarR family winged helix-turn-helix transcriptional regulator [Ornithinibacillus sp. 4-3]|uniref:MarR family winged helix-turn-helix transcriptional regulator n=1 Tax=Ornithinibacillus sp. 4-3 TaxID=3231488 RepID=A0AB39HM91_9BACI
MENIEKSIVESEIQLRKIAGMIKRKGRNILTSYPITSPQFAALYCVIEEGDLTIGELSNRIGLAFSTTTDIVDRMEGNGLVKRVRDEKDRRVVRIHALDKGREILREVIHKRQEYLGEVLDGMPNAQIDQLNELLALLLDRMQIVDEKYISR